MALLGWGEKKKKSAAESSLIVTIQLRRSKQTQPYLQVNKSTARSVCQDFFQSASNHKDQMIPDNTRRRLGRTDDAKRNYTSKRTVTFYTRHLQFKGLLKTVQSIIFSKVETQLNVLKTAPSPAQRLI